MYYEELNPLHDHLIEFPSQNAKRQSCLAGRDPTGRAKTPRPTQTKKPNLILWT